MERDSQFAVYPNKKKTLKTLIGGVVLLIVQIFLITIETDEVPKELNFLFAYIGIPFFSLGIVYLVYRLVIKKPVFVIDKIGILDQSSLLSVGIIRWDEIESIEAVKIANTNFMGVNPKDKDAFLARLNPIKKFFLSMNLNMGQSLINIPLESFGLDFDQVASKLKEYSEVKIRT